MRLRALAGSRARRENLGGLAKGQLITDHDDCVGHLAAAPLIPLTPNIFVHLVSVVRFIEVDELLVEVRRFGHVPTIRQCILLAEQLLGLLWSQRRCLTDLTEDEELLLLRLRWRNSVTLIIRLVRDFLDLPLHRVIE